METRFLEYIKKIKMGDYKPAIKICWLYPDETVKSSFTEAMYDISGTINITYQTGTRRTCSLTINNKNGQFPIDYENIWIGQKFQVWAGIYLDDGTPYYISQGIFCITNPKEVYNPNTKTLVIQGSDKWCYLDGTLFGYLTGGYQQIFGTRLDLSAFQLLQSNKYNSFLTITNDTEKQIDCKPCIFSPTFYTQTRDVTQYTSDGELIYVSYENKESGLDESSCLYILKQIKLKDEETNSYIFKTITQKVVENENGEYEIVDFVDTSSKKESEEGVWEIGENDILYVKKENVFYNPYTVKLETGKTLADYYKEMGTILTANVFYDNFGYMRFEPMSLEIEDINDEDKEIMWNFFDTDKNFLGLELDYDFSSVYNDIIVLGKIINGYRAKARIQNQDSNSATNIDLIGVKTKPPYEDDIYYTDNQCLDLAKYYARTEMAMQKKVNIKSLTMYHLDVNKLVSLTLPSKGMINEKFLISDLSIPLAGGTMTIGGTNLKDFSNWTSVDVYLENEEELEEEEEEDGTI